MGQATRATREGKELFAEAVLRVEHKITEQGASYRVPVSRTRAGVATSSCLLSWAAAAFGKDSGSGAKV